MKVLFVASECIPFIKIGGLADVAGTLPIELAKYDGMEIAVFVPKYSEINEEWKQKMQHKLYFFVNLGWRRQYCGVDKLEHNNVTYYFIDNEFYFGREGVYGYGNEEGERFAFFCRAVLEAMPLVDFKPDIIHCNDWQTGMIPALLEMQYNNLEYYKGVKTVYTIHNLKYQGIFPWGWTADMLGISDKYFSAQYLEYFGCLNFMKGGLVFSDRVTTVSPTYAEEIKTPYYGERLDGLINSHADKIQGILDGIDIEDFDPANDKLMAKNFTADNIKGKEACKAALLAECGLEVDVKKPLIGMVTRLIEQKGLDLIEHVFEDIMRNDVQICLLGKGNEKYHEFFNWAAWRYEGRVFVRIGYDDILAHKIYAGSDFFLMPSQFEPCGISQLIAMRYGTIPIVRETGGLKDTVKPYIEDNEKATGFSFVNYNAHEMLFTIEKAITLYRDHRDVIDKIAVNAMNEDFSWENSAKAYMNLYKSIVEA